MQIHEITRGNNRRQSQLDEGLWDTIKGAAKDFAGSKWLNSTAQAQAQQDSKLAQQSKQYVDQITKQWMTAAPDLLTKEFYRKYQNKLKLNQPITEKEQNITFKEVFAKWVNDTLKTPVNGHIVTVDDVMKRVPEMSTTLPPLMNGVLENQDEQSVKKYLSAALSGMQQLSREVQKRTKEKDKQRAEKRLQSTDSAFSDEEDEKSNSREFKYKDKESGKTFDIAARDNNYYRVDPNSKRETPITDKTVIEKIKQSDPAMTSSEKKPYQVDKEEEQKLSDLDAERSFNYTDNNGDETEVFVKDGNYFLQDPDTEELVPVEDQDDIEYIETYDPESDKFSQTPPEDSELAKTVPEKELKQAAKKVSADTSDTPNIPDAKFRVIDWTPNLVIRVGGKEFMMNDDNYPERKWFIYPGGSPVKAAMIPSLNKMADEAFKYQDEASADGQPETDIDVGATENAGVRVEPGTKLRVRDPRNNGVYYKDALGNWTTEEGRRLKKPETLKYLENKVKTDGETRVEKVLPPTPEEKKKGATA